MNSKILSLLLTAVMAGTVGYAQNVTTPKNLRSATTEGHKTTALTINPAAKKSGAKVTPAKKSATKIAPESRLKVQPKAKAAPVQPVPAVSVNPKVSRAK